MVENRAFRRGLAAVALLVTGWFLVRGLMQGSVADSCASELVQAVERKDEAWLLEHVKSPSLKARLLDAHRPDLLFVRPQSEEWSRIGLAVRKSDTATVATPLYVLLSHAEKTCSFIQDYDAGAR